MDLIKRPGYNIYTVARRYEFHVRVARTISHSILVTVNIFELTYNVLFVIETN